MRMRWLRHLIAILLLSAVTRSGHAQYRDAYPLPHGTIPDVMGVNIHFTDPRPGEMEQLANAGFKWVRQDFYWEGIERVKGQYDFAPYERLMAQLKRFHIRPIFILDYGNKLYQEGSPNTPESRAAFGRFASAAVTHFKGQGIVWEMWNEPNIGFWKPKPNWDEYIALALETGKAIRKAAPAEWFVGPGMSGMDFPFLQRCLQAGLLNYWDAVSFHPYRDTAPETAGADFAHVRDLIEQYGPRGEQIPILSSEWGYSELYPGLDRERQSWYIARQTLTSLIYGLDISIWYDWHDDGTDVKEAEHHFGTLYNDYREKETYRAAQTLSKTLGGFRYGKRLALNSPEDYCLLFERYEGVCLAVWTTSRTPHTVVIPASAGSFRMVSYLGEASQKTTTTEGIALTLTEAPVYIVPSKKNNLLEIAQYWSFLPPYLRFGDQQSLITLAELSEDFGIGASSQLKLQQAVGSDPKKTEFRTVRTLPMAEGKVVPIPADLHTLVDRSDVPHRFRAVLTAKGHMPLIQETLLVSRDPIRVTAMPPFGSLLPVQINNVSGKALHARLHVHVDKDDQKVAVDFRTGETAKRIDVPLARPLNAESTLRLVLEDRATPGAIPLVTAPVVRFQSLLSFAATPVGTVLDPMVRLFPDGDPKVVSHQDFTLVKAPSGLVPSEQGAGKIDYEFASGWKFLRVAPPSALEKPLAGEPDALGMWVHSDGSHNLLRARFVDATGQTFQPDGGTLDFQGWRYVTFPLHPGGGHWGGANDDRVHYPIRIDSLFLIDTPDQKGAKGQIYFANVGVIYTSER